jgi:rare lipoprotein A
MVFTMFGARWAGWLRSLAAISLLGLLAACAGGPRAEVSPAALPVVGEPAPIVSGTMRPYQVGGRWYRPAEQPDYDETGMASWYGDAFNGKPTATGERFDMNALTAAHKTLPLPGLVEVTNLANGRSAVLRVNDRGPFVDGRIIDLSRGAADALDLRRAGVGRVRVRYLGPAPRLGGGQVMQRAEQAAPVARPEPRPEPRQFWVQAGAFSDRLAAALVAEQLGARVELGVVGGPAPYRVMLGPWPDVNAAEAARQAALARGAREALLISGG